MSGQKFLATFLMAVAAGLIGGYLVMTVQVGFGLGVLLLINGVNVWAVILSSARCT